jgi:hypothetical protein
VLYVLNFQYFKTLSSCILNCRTCWCSGNALNLERFTVRIPGHVPAFVIENFHGSSQFLDADVEILQMYGP